MESGDNCDGCEKRGMGLGRRPISHKGKGGKSWRRGAKRMEKSIRLRKRVKRRFDRGTEIRGSEHMMRKVDELGEEQMSM